MKAYQSGRGAKKARRFSRRVLWRSGTSTIFIFKVARTSFHFFKVLTLKGQNKT